jgi:hypothetical protein
MKQVYLLLVLSLTAICMVSCDMKVRSTPLAQAATQMVRTSAEGVQDTIHFTDTLRVGDTVRVQVVLNGYYNPLTAYNVSSDTAAMRLALEVKPELQSALARGTDLEKGKIVFVSDQVFVFTTGLRYTPRKSGTHRIEMYVYSDAGESYSPQYYYFDVQVK